MLGIVFMTAVLSTAVHYSEIPANTIVREDTFYGFKRTVFKFEGCEAWVVKPSVEPAAGHPWTWTMQWAEAYVPRTPCLQLLKKGWHHVTINTFDYRMNAEGLRISAAFQQFLVAKLGLSPKASLIGMSWGGFFSTRYTSNYPDNVSAVYLDCPLLNFDSFDHNLSAETSWGKLGRKRGEWTDDPEMPINMAAKLAATKIPFYLVYGGQDQTIDPVSSSELFEHRFLKAGGNLKVMYRKLYGHHPHGVEVDDPTLANFFISAR